MQYFFIIFKNIADNRTQNNVMNNFQQTIKMK